MKTLGLLAQQILDKYYQDFADDAAFFQVEDVMADVVDVYSKLIMDDYSIQKLVNRQEFGFSFVGLAPDLLQNITVDVTLEDGRQIAKLPVGVMIFPFDTMMTGVQSVRNASAQDTSRFIKVSVQDRWKLDSAPQAAVSFYSVEPEMIVFDKLAQPAKKVVVNYAPLLDDTCQHLPINDFRAMQIQSQVLQLMLVAKNGVVVDKSNDKNPNTNPQTETAPENLNQLK